MARCTTPVDACGSDEVRAEVESRLHLVPKLRKRVRLPLVGESAPVWVDDPDFDIANHVHQAALPEPGDEAQLLDLCARLMACPLDRAHPLWDIWLIDGLEGGRVAVFEMLHHALADGLAGVELATVLLDLEPRAPTPHPGDGWQPAPPPGRVEVAVDGLATWADAIWRLTADGLSAVRHPSRAGHLLARYAGAFASLLPRPAAVPGCSLNVPVGFDRRAVVVRHSLRALRRAEHHFGVTLNDLLLTAIASGVHDLLSARGEVTEGRLLQVLVPVGSDHHGDHRLGNEVSAMVVRLPIGAAAADDRLREVARAERSSKEHDQASATHLLLSSLDALPPAAVAAASHLVHHQPFVNLVVTNVPGPTSRSTCSGRACSRPSHSCRSGATSAWAWRRSPTTAGWRSASSPTPTPAPTSTSSPAVSTGASTSSCTWCRGRQPAPRVPA